jgi:tRNA pseudouridine38-40 synthase
MGFWDGIREGELEGMEMGDVDFAKEGEVDRLMRTPVYLSNLERRRGWRISDEMVNKVKECLKMYIGSHNFHNFTIGKDSKDRSCQRVMRNLSVTEPIVLDGTEWITIKFHGQSFMLHQIVGFGHDHLSFLGDTSLRQDLISEK